MPRDKESSSAKTAALCGAIALGALIAHNLPPHKESKPRRREERPVKHRSPTPPPTWRRTPPLIDYDRYREERYYLRYGDEEGDLLCVVDQRPIDGSVTGPEVRRSGEGGRFEVERYYRGDGREAGPEEAGRVVKRGYPKWDR